MRQGLETGDRAPEFSLIGSDGMIHTLVDYKGYKGVCFCFFSLKCEKSKLALQEITSLKERFTTKSISFVGVCAKDESSSFSGILDELKSLGLDFDILLDATSDLSRKFGIEVTPHFFIFNQSKHLIYSGRCKDKDTNTNYVANALDQLVGALPIETPETEPVGTSVNPFASV